MCWCTGSSFKNRIGKREIRTESHDSGSRSFSLKKEEGRGLPAATRRNDERLGVTGKQWRQSVPGIHRRAQAKLSGVFGTEKKVQVRIQAGIPFAPAMLPVRSGEVASIVAEDFYGLGAISLGLRIKNELGLARRRKSGVLGGRRSRLGTLIHRRDGRSAGTPHPLASMTPSFG